MRVCGAQCAVLLGVALGVEWCAASLSAASFVIFIL